VLFSSADSSGPLWVRKSAHFGERSGGANPPPRISSSVNRHRSIRTLALGKEQPMMAERSAQVRRPSTNGMGFDSLEGGFCSRSSVGRASDTSQGVGSTRPMRRRRSWRSSPTGSFNHR